MPWIVPRGTVGLWTHGGGRPEAREEISECGLIIQYFSQQIPRVTKSSHENCYFTETVAHKIMWRAGLFSSLVEKWLLVVFGFYR